MTAADIEALVAKAVEAAVSGGPAPLSASEVGGIVAKAVAAIPIAPVSKPTLPLPGSEFIVVVKAVGVPVYHQPVAGALNEEITRKLV